MQNKLIVIFYGVRQQRRRRLRVDLTKAAELRVYGIKHLKVKLKVMKIVISPATISTDTKKILL